MSAIITLLTDFGLDDAYVGVMHGVILGIAPDARVVDLTHAIPPQDVRAGAFQLRTAWRYFPAGTIHVAVVDPGVGTDRRIVAVSAGAHTFVGPDNGVLRWAVDAAGGSSKIVAVEAPAYRLAQTSATFHGRDIMAPAAAHLAAGVPLAALGPALAGLLGQEFPAPNVVEEGLRGEVIYVDHFGNAITNLPHPAGTLTAHALEVAGRQLPLAPSYGFVPSGEALAVTGSSGFVEVAVRNGSAARLLNLHPGAACLLRSM